MFQPFLILNKISNAALICFKVRLLAHSTLIPVFIQLLKTIFKCPFHDRYQLFPHVLLNLVNDLKSLPFTFTDDHQKLS